jgi:hypothetical protein
MEQIISLIALVLIFTWYDFIVLPKAEKANNVKYNSISASYFGLGNGWPKYIIFMLLLGLFTVAVSVDIQHPYATLFGVFSGLLLMLCGVNAHTGDSRRTETKHVIGATGSIISYFVALVLISPWYFILAALMALFTIYCVWFNGKLKGWLVAHHTKRIEEVAFGLILIGLTIKFILA